MFLTGLSSILLIYWGQNVYRTSAASNYSTAFFVNLAYLNLTKLFANDTNMEVSFNTLTGISLLQFVGLVLYKLVSFAKRNRRVKSESAEYDLELFERRKIESESDEEEHLVDDDMDNLPTY